MPPQLASSQLATGNMGSEIRFDYSVIGDAVNLGARLEGQTGECIVGKTWGQKLKEKRNEI